MKLPTEVSNIIKTLNQNGYEAYAVGGSVRDCIMGKTPKDWAITPSALPEQVKSLFPQTFDTGILHGTVTVVMNATNYEVTTYRIDGEYFDNRRPAVVSFTSNLKEDLLRRDFTMNAVAYHPEEGFVDFYGGIEDIKNKIVRGVGNPSKRFQEDALRMMRAVRFSARLNFEIEENTWLALVENAALIKNISMERVRDEFLKLLSSSNPEKINLLCSSQLMKYIEPLLFAHLQKTNPYLSKAFESSDINIRLATVLRGYSQDEKAITNLLKYFKLDNKAIKLVQTLLKHIEMPLQNDFYEIRKRLSQVGIEVFPLLLQLNFIFAEQKEFLQLNEIFDKYNLVISENHCYSLKDLKINGNDLKELGLTNGAEIGIALNSLLEHVLKNPNDNDTNILKCLFKV